jgi:hypothetical protein
MNIERLKSLRMKQIMFINVCICVIIPLFGWFVIIFEPSPSDTYLLGVFLYGALLLIELWGLFFPKHVLFMHGPRFMREIAEYERDKLGKRQDQNGRIVRIVAFTFLVGVQFMAFTRITNDEPMQFQDVSGFWTIIATVVLLFLILGNTAILYRIHKIDKTEPLQFRWFTLKSLALGVLLGMVSVVLLSAGFAIALR